MKNKIVGILVGTLLIAAAVLPVAGTMNVIKNKTLSSTQLSGVEWSKTYGGPAYDVFYDVQQTNDGGYIASGNYEENDRYYPRVMKVDSNGNELWNWTLKELYYNDTTFEVLDNWAPGIIQASDGKYVVCFYVLVEIEGVEVAAGGLAKLDESGSEVWLKPIFEENVWWTVPTDLIEISDGFIISGEGSYVGEPEDDVSAVLVKTDLTGEIIWNKIYNYGEYEDLGNAVCKTTDDGFLITGIAEVEQSEYEYWMIKTDSDGELVWDQTFSGDNNDYSYAHDCLQTDDGGYIMCGQGFSYGHGRSDAWIVKTDSQGNMAWHKSYGGKNHDLTWSIGSTNDNKFVFCVNYNWNSLSGDVDDIHLVKIDNSGNIEGVQVFGGPEIQTGTSVRQTSDGGFIVCGRNGRSYSTKSDAMLVKFAPYGDNNAPDTPIITGETSGVAGTEYEFTFNAVDPDGSEVKYVIDWGDGSTDETSFELSGWDVMVTHTWSKTGTYTIKVKAVDVFGTESSEGTLTVTMPRNRIINTRFLNILENHPYIYLILKQLLQRL